MAKKPTPAIMAETLLKLVGEKENISSFTNCMTRLRISVKSLRKVNEAELKASTGVLGVVKSGNEIQIILGPGFVNKTAQALRDANPDISYGGEVDVNNTPAMDTLASVAATEKARQKAKNTSPIQVFMTKISKIFAPLIFGFIGAGILAGIGGIIQSSATSFVDGDTTTRVWNSAFAESWFNILNVTLNIWKTAFVIVVGWRTAEVFGGSGVVGGIAAGFFVTSFSGFYTAPFVEQITEDGQHYLNFLGIKIMDPATNWLTIGFRPGGSAEAGWTLDYASGGIFGAMMIAGFGVPIEKQIRKIMPDTIDIVGSSTLTYLLLVALAYTLIIPVSGLMFEIVNSMFIALYTNPFGAAVLAGIFLLAVTFGVHQGFVPIYASLVAKTGINGLFSALAMAGAGQVGVALSVMQAAPTGSLLKEQVKGAIVPGILGIGEPLIYAMSLPRPKLFVSGMIGGAVGGFFMGAINLWGGMDVGLNTMFGPSGLLAAPLMTTPKGNIGLAIPMYLCGLAVSYAAGYGATRLIGFKGVDLS